jgi:hypothetical protein
MECLYWNFFYYDCCRPFPVLLLFLSCARKTIDNSINDCSLIFFVDISYNKLETYWSKKPRPSNNSLSLILYHNVH